MSQKVCSVCYDDITDNCIKTPCGHLFHNQCLTTWLLEKTSCPICRFQIGERSIDEDFEEEEQDTYLVDVAYTSDRGHIADPNLEEIVIQETMTIIEDDNDEFVDCWFKKDDLLNLCFYIRHNHENVKVHISKDESNNLVYVDIQSKIYKKQNKYNNKKKSKNYIYNNKKNKINKIRHPRLRY